MRRPYIRGLSGRVWNAAVFERALAMIAAGLKVRHELNPAATAWARDKLDRTLTLDAWARSHALHVEPDDRCAREVRIF